MIEITYQMVLSTLQTIALVVGIVYYLIIMRNSQRTRELTLQSQELTRKAQEQALETRQAQLFMSVYQNHVSRENISDWIEMINLWEWDDYDDFREKYSVPSSLENSSKYGSYINRLEGLGVLAKRGLIDVNFLYDLMYGSIIIIWEKFNPIIMESRRRINVPNLYEDVEYLYDEMVRIREERGPLKNTP